MRNTSPRQKQSPLLDIKVFLTMIVRFRRILQYKLLYGSNRGVPIEASVTCIPKQHEYYGSSKHLIFPLVKVIIMIEVESKPK